MSEENGVKKKKNGWNGKGQRFGYEKPAIAGPGRPRLPESVKQERQDARQLFKEKAYWMASRILELANNEDEDISLKALKIGIDKVLPNLEELETNDNRPLPALDDAQVRSQLAIIRASHHGRSSGTSTPEGNGVAK